MCQDVLGYAKYDKEELNMGKRYLTAQEAAEKLGLSKQTVLRYEKKGIFPQPKRNLVNGWREYTEGDLGKLKEILGRI